eukprot:CAMPEP_0178964682 /NCGR_PEP_ID=MMETSP0789-20121207/15819_1 /TAXON_ID=3005 /ORGANISM="Rhizosolenia setigera, Strain CCMP 1694" /LENGTH=259 /DNA_ID=CAMNT_0020649497 /DNA_START=76 /DNA_END=855 /DNA_ORIENTATION=-
MKLTLSSGMILSMASSFMLSTRNCVVAFNNNAALVGLSKNRPFLQHHQLSTKSQRGGSILSFLSSTQKEMEEEVDPGVVEGTDLRVLKYPHPSLRAENAIITDEELASGEITKISKEMFLVMYAAQGVGLAAPQVGINKRLMVYNPSGDKKKWLDETTLVNPKIVEFSDAKDVETEGCLSFPGMNGDVERSKWIKVEAQSLKGKKIKKKFKGWEARIFQHEYDHLDGTVYIDRLSEEGRTEVQPVLDELVEVFGEGGEL